MILFNAPPSVHIQYNTHAHFHHTWIKPNRSPQVCVGTEAACIIDHGHHTHNILHITMLHNHITHRKWLAATFQWVSRTTYIPVSYDVRTHSYKICPPVCNITQCARLSYTILYYTTSSIPINANFYVYTHNTNCHYTCVYGWTTTMYWCTVYYIAQVTNIQISSGLHRPKLTSTGKKKKRSEGNRIKTATSRW